MCVTVLCRRLGPWSLRVALLTAATQAKHRELVQNFKTLDARINDIGSRQSDRGHIRVKVDLLMN